MAAIISSHLIHHPLWQLLGVPREQYGVALDVQWLRNGFVAAEVGAVLLKFAPGFHCARWCPLSDVVEKSRQQNLTKKKVGSSSDRAAC